MKSKLKIVTEAPPTFKVEKGIPVASRKKPNPYATFFSTLKVGDSFWVKANFNSLRQYSYMAAKKNKARYLCKEEKGGVRCWRIK